MLEGDCDYFLVYRNYQLEFVEQNFPSTELKVFNS